MILCGKRRTYAYAYKMSPETLKTLTVSYNPWILFILSPRIQTVLLI